MTEADDVPQEPFEVRRRGWLYVLLLLGAWGLAAGYGWLGYDRDEVYLYVLAGALGLLGLVFATTMRHLRTPLLVADLHGVRMQHKSGWAGLLWREVGDIAVLPRRGLSSPYIRVRGLEDDREHTVTLGLGTDVAAPTAEIELARRREAASY